MDLTSRPYKHMLMHVWGAALCKGGEWQEVQTGWQMGAGQDQKKKGTSLLLSAALQDSDWDLSAGFISSHSLITKGTN